VKHGLLPLSTTNKRLFLNGQQVALGLEWVSVNAASSAQHLIK
jgi:hypothetical protein